MNTKNNEKKLIAVVGATGKQGGAVVRALQASGQFNVRALSRDPSKHRELADEVVEADLNRPETLKAAFEGAHGVFLVTNFFQEKGADELKQATAAVRAAKDAGVNGAFRHFLSRRRRDCGDVQLLPSSYLFRLGVVRPNCARYQNSRQATDKVFDLGPT